ncbi:MAG: DUF92 domain-containing protein [Candidatus Methanodesulfokora sp.]
MLNDQLAGLLLVMIVALLGYKKGAVNLSGLASGIVIGSAVVLIGGLLLFLPLLTFFVIGSIFTKYKYDLKEIKGAAESEKGRRGWSNVLANGIPPLIFLLIWKISSNDGFLLAFFSSIAADTSDTLSNEVGVLSKKDPVLLFYWRRVPAGTSGAISSLGTIAAFLSSLLISLESYIISGGNTRFLVIPAFCGFLGSIIDSILGALVQEKRVCPSCGRITENKSHCGFHTRHIAGVKGFGNGLVNFIMSLAAGVISLVIP